MVDPGTAILISTAIASAAKGAGDYFSGQSAAKAGKRRARETKRETESSLVHEALQRNAELEAQRLASSQKLNKRKTQSMQDTASLMREAFNI